MGKKKDIIKDVKIFENELENKLIYDADSYVNIESYLYNLFYFIIYGSSFRKEINIIENIINKFITKEMERKNNMFKDLTEMVNNLYHDSEFDFDIYVNYQIRTQIKQIYLLKRVDAVFNFYKNNYMLYRDNNLFRIIQNFCRSIII